MDDIFDSLIYIIITIVAFAISILGKKRKKQKQAFSSGQEPYKKEEEALLPDLEKIIREQVGLRDPYTYEEQFIEQEEVIQEEKSSEILDVVPPETKDDKKDVPYSIEYDDTSEIFKTAIKDTDISKSDEDEEVIENFNLHDAVIYSEILKRKEY